MKGTSRGYFGDALQSSWSFAYRPETKSQQIVEIESDEARVQVSMEVDAP